jgi:neutral ceramidase
MARGELQAGVAAVTITPPVGGYLQGYTRGRPSVGVHLDLRAAALVLDDGATRVGLVTLDLLGLDRATVAAMRAAIDATTEVPGAHVMIACSHTHAGPHVQGTGADDWGFAVGNGLDEAYVATLVRHVAGVVGMAARGPRPAAVGLGTGEAGFAVNRRRLVAGRAELRPNPDGPVDRRARVLKIMDAAEAPADRPAPPPRAVLFAYSCHPTIMAMENLEVSPDYPGVARAFVETAYRGARADHGLPDGPGTVALFVQGGGGDLRPHLTTPDGEHFRAGAKADAHRLGWQLGAAVVKAAESITATTRHAELGVAATTVALPLAAPPSRAVLEGIIANGGSEHFGGHRTTDGRPLSDLAWARHTLRQADRGPLPTALEVEVQALRIGDLHLVGLPGEVMCEIGWQIERALPGPTIVVSQANGNIGYLCTERSYREGGYEPAVAYKLYHLPAPFEPSVEGALVAAGSAVRAAMTRDLIGARR